MCLLQMTDELAAVLDESGADVDYTPALTLILSYKPSHINHMNARGHTALTHLLKKPPRERDGEERDQDAETMR